MKNIIRQTLFIILVAEVFSFKIKGANIVTTTIEITEEAINLFINHQYNKVGFQQEIQGSESGVTYDITLNLPNIKLLDNQAKIEFGFKIESNVFNGIIEFEDDLSFTVPNIEELTVKAVSQAFVNKVNSLNIHTVLKNAIIAAWQSLELEAYPMQLAKVAENTEWIAERGISVVDPYFSISFDVEPGTVNISLNTYLEGAAPLFTAYLTTKEDYENGVSGTPTSDDYFHFYTPINITVEEIKIYNSNGQQLYSLTPDELGYKKEKSFVRLGFNRLNPANYYTVKVLYTTNDTFYMRQYNILCSVGYTHNGEWFYDYFTPNNTLN